MELSVTLHKILRWSPWEKILKHYNPDEGCWALTAYGTDHYAVQGCSPFPQYLFWRCDDLCTFSPRNITWLNRFTRFHASLRWKNRDMRSTRRQNLGASVRNVRVFPFVSLLYFLSDVIRKRCQEFWVDLRWWRQKVWSTLRRCLWWSALFKECSRRLGRCATLLFVFGWFSLGLSLGLKLLFL